MIYDDWREFKITNIRRSPIDVRKLGTKWWEMRGDGCLFSLEWDLGPFGLFVPLGYQCDGASIPKAFRDVVDPETAFDWSWPHDMGYEAHGGDRPYKVWLPDGTFRLERLTNHCTGESLSLSRARMDAILLAGWISSGMKRREAMEGYAAVRQFGDHAWDSEEPTGASLPPPEAPSAAVAATIMKAA
jgi:hypothetical protein